MVLYKRTKEVHKIERNDDMKITIKKYVARVAEFVEHEDGSITKEIREIVLDGKRFTPETAERAIPRNCQLVDSGWKQTVYEIDSGKLDMFCKEYGEDITGGKFQIKQILY